MSREDLTADALMNAPRVQDKVQRRVGDPNRPGLTGLPLVDVGMACEGSMKSGCFLSETKRLETLILFTGRVNFAATQFGLAVMATRAEKLMEKDQDPAWFVSLVLDLVGSFLLSKFASGLLKLRDGVNLEIAANAAANGAGSDSWTKARTALSKVTKKDFESVLKPAFDESKKVAKSAWTGQDLSKREFMQDYLDILTDKGGLGFSQIRDLGPVGKTDAELVALTHAFDPDEHKYTHYKAALDEKLTRLEKSGVMTIGSTQETRHKPVAGGGSWRTPVDRHKRVVWVSFTSGRKSQLAFQQQDGLGEVLPATRSLHLRWGHGQSFFDAETAGYVPAEFVDVAISRHITIWGVPPPTVTVNDGWWTDAGSDRGQPSASKPPASGSKPPALVEPSAPNPPVSQHAPGSATTVPAQGRPDSGLVQTPPVDETVASFSSEPLHSSTSLTP